MALRTDLVVEFVSPMAIPRSKAELLDAIHSSYEKLVAEIMIGAQARGVKSRDRFLENTVAYQIGWGKLLIGWYEAGIKSVTPEMPAPGYKWNALGPLNESFYKRHANDALPGLLTKDLSQ